MRHLNENQIFQYNGSPITFQKGDSVMVNATEMAKPFGKRCNDFLSTKQTKELISSLSAKTGISATGLVTVNQGGNNQGTWMHEDVALEFLSTLSAVRIIPLTGLVDKAFKKILFSFGSLRNCCTFAVLQLTIKYANGIFYARKETYILKYRQTISVYHRPMAMVGCSKLGYLSAFLFNNK